MRSFSASMGCASGRLLGALILLFCPGLARAGDACADYQMRDIAPAIRAALADAPSEFVTDSGDGQFHIRLPKDQFGGDAGISRQIRLETPPARTACLQYDLWLPAEFAFMRGGKLPGLYGGPAGMNRSNASGCLDPEDRTGWSMRLMWRADGAGEAYAYLKAPQERCGISLGRGNWVFPRAQWVRIQIITTLDDRKGTGTLAVYLDGRRVLWQPDLTYADSPENGVHGLFLSAFFGGNGPEWAPPKDQYLMLRNLKFGINPPGSSGDSSDH